MWPKEHNFAAHAFNLKQVWLKLESFLIQMIILHIFEDSSYCEIP